MLLARIKSNLHEHLSVFWFLLINCAIQLCVYLWQAVSLIDTVKASPNIEDLILFGTYTSAMLISWAVILYAMTAALPSRIRFNPAHKVALATATALIVLIVLDNKVFSILGVHLYDPTVVQNLQNKNVTRPLQLSTGTIVAACVFVILVAFVQVGILRLCARFADAQAARGRRLLAATLFGSFAVLCPSLMIAHYMAAPAERHGNMVLSTMPLYSVLFEDRANQQPLHVEYPNIEEVSAQMRTRKSVLIVLAESFRSDFLVPDLTPNLCAFEQQRASITSGHHSAGTHVTEFGVFSLLYGLHSFHYSPFMHERTRSLPLEILRHNGYEMIGLVSEPLEDWNYADFIFEPFDAYHTFMDESPEIDDRAMVEWVRAFHDKRSSERPFLLFVFLTSSHHNYRYPPEFEKFTPVLPADHNYFLETKHLEDSRALVVNRYKNSLMYVDHLFGELLDIFAEDIANDDLVVLFSSDHGEEFWEHGLLGHSATRFVNQRTQVPLLMMLPGVRGRQVELSCHADIMPTLLDYAGTDPMIPASRYSNGLSLLSPPLDDRHVVITGAGFPFGNDFLCLMTPQAKYWLKKHDRRLSDLKTVLITDHQDNRLSSAPDDFAKYMSRLKREFYKFMHEQESTQGADAPLPTHDVLKR